MSAKKCLLIILYVYLYISTLSLPKHIQQDPFQYSGNLDTCRTAHRYKNHNIRRYNYFFFAGTEDLCIHTYCFTPTHYAVEGNMGKDFSKLHLSLVVKSSNFSFFSLSLFIEDL